MKLLIPSDNLGKWARSSVHKARTSDHCCQTQGAVSGDPYALSLLSGQTIPIAFKNVDTES